MFKQPFSFEGRIRRTEYGISFIIFIAALGFFSAIIDAIPDAAIIAIAIIPMYWFLFSQAAKRCHDVGNSGWWQLIPLYGFWLLFQEGDNGRNQYGENPKGQSANQQYNANNYNSVNTNQQQPNNSSGGYQSNYDGGHNNHNNHNNSNYSNNNNSNVNNNNSSSEYKKDNLY